VQAAEDLQPVGCDDIAIVDPGVAGGVVVQRRPWRIVAVAVAVALVAEVVRVGGQPVARRGGEVAVQDRPAGGMLVDQIGAGGVGVAAEVAGDRLEQDPALVGGVAVVVAVDAVKAALRGGRTMTDRVPTVGASWCGLGSPSPA
jgi:hypothetical protein